MIWGAISYQGDRVMQFIERITRFLQVPEDYEEEVSPPDEEILCKVHTGNFSKTMQDPMFKKM